MCSMTSETSDLKCKLQRGPKPSLDLDLPRATVTLGSPGRRDGNGPGVPTLALRQTTKQGFIGELGFRFVPKPPGNSSGQRIAGWRARPLERGGEVWRGRVQGQDLAQDPAPRPRPVPNRRISAQPEVRCPARSEQLCGLLCFMYQPERKNSDRMLVN